MLIIEGPCGNGIGRGLSSALRAGFAECRHAVFPDGESEVGLGAPVKDEDVFIVQSTYPMQDKRLMELLILADDARGQGARSVGAVVPYLAYARQDMRFEEKGNAVSVNTVLGLLGAVGITTLVTVSPHKRQPLSRFKGRAIVPDVTAAVARGISGAVRDPVVLAPDAGALGLAGDLARVLGCSYSNIDKKRDRLTGKVSIVRAPDQDLEGKDVVIADDMISTGGTMAQAARFAREAGARKMIAVATHLLVTDAACGRLRDAGVSEIYGTNTVPCGSKEARIIDVSAAIAEAMSAPAMP